MKKRLIIYDSGENSTENPFKQDDGTLLFNAFPTVNHCIGCFG